MKRILFCTLALLLLLSACAAGGGMPKDNNYHPETDFPYAGPTVMQGFAMSSIVQGGEGYYLYVPHTLFYLDRGAAEPVPVCGRPDCMHYDEPKLEDFRACSAYLNAFGMTQLCYWDGYLYTMQEVLHGGAGKQRMELLRISADGSERKSLWTFGIDPTVSEMILHRGYLYWANRSFDESGNTIGGLYRFSLQESGAKPELLVEMTVSGQDVLQNLTAYGQRLYFRRFTSTDETARYTPEGSAQVMEFCIYDLNTGELKSLPNEEGRAPFTLTFAGGKLLLGYSAANPENAELYPVRLYRCELDGEGRTYIGEDCGIFTADDRYIYRLATPLYGLTDDQRLYIYDTDYQLLDSVGFDDVLTPGSYTLVSTYVCADDSVFVCLMERTDTGYKGRRDHIFRFDKSAIGSGAITLEHVIDFGNEYSEYHRYD